MTVQLNTSHNKNPKQRSFEKSNNQTKQKRVVSKKSASCGKETYHSNLIQMVFLIDRESTLR